MELFDHQRRILTSEWWHYIRELQKDPAYEGRKAQFLAQKKEREPVGSEPLQEEDKENLTSSILPNRRNL